MPFCAHFHCPQLGCAGRGAQPALLAALLACWLGWWAAQQAVLAAWQVTSRLAMPRLPRCRLLRVRTTRGVGRTGRCTATLGSPSLTMCLRVIIIVASGLDVPAPLVRRRGAGCSRRQGQLPVSRVRRSCLPLRAAWPCRLAPPRTHGMGGAGSSEPSLDRGKTPPAQGRATWQLCGELAGGCAQRSGGGEDARGGRSIDRSWGRGGGGQHAVRAVPDHLLQDLHAPALQL